MNNYTSLLTKKDYEKFGKKNNLGKLILVDFYNKQESLKSQKDLKILLYYMDNDFITNLYLNDYLIVDASVNDCKHPLYNQADSDIEEFKYNTIFDLNKNLINFMIEKTQDKEKLLSDLLKFQTKETNITLEELAFFQKSNAHYKRVIKDFDAEFGELLNQSCSSYKIANDLYTSKTIIENYKKALQENEEALKSIQNRSKYNSKMQDYILSINQSQSEQ